MKKPAPLPLDIRLMNTTAAVLFVLGGVLVLALVLSWLVRLPAFAIRSVIVEGEVIHHNAITLRANVMPQLSGNFFTLDLQRARAAFEAVPWIRLAVVQRQFPNRLRVMLAEHQPIALWGDESGNAMVNRQGQVFEAEADDQEVSNLPRFKGPQGTSLQVMKMHAYLVPVFKAMDLQIELLELSPRGNWRVETHTGAQIELGRGTQEEIGQRLQLFWHTLSQVTARYGRTPTSLEAADLRHVDGYALRLKGVRTLEPVNKQP